MGRCKRIRMIRKLFMVGLLLAVVVALTLVWSSVAFFKPALADQGGSSIWTDKADYGLGETVTITGTGWFPNETVSMVIHQDPQRNPDTHLTSLTDENGTCTFNNTQLGSITIEKQTLPDGGIGFGFTDDIEAPNSFSLNDDQTKTFSNVLPGTYTITESSLPTDWDLTSIVCDDANSTGDMPTATATIKLEAGETVTCTFTNEEPAVPQARIGITKTVTPTSAAPGDTVDYTIEYENPGGTTLNNVFIVDDPDENYIASVSHISDGGTYDDDKISWTIGILNALDSSGSVTYKATLKGASAFPPAGSTNIDNTATIYSDETEPLSDDARVTVTTGPVVVGGTVVPVDKAAIWRRGLLCLSPL